MRMTTSRVSLRDTLRDRESFSTRDIELVGSELRPQSLVTCRRCPRCTLVWLIRTGPGEQIQSSHKKANLGPLTWGRAEDKAQEVVSPPCFSGVKYSYVSQMPFPCLKSTAERQLLFQHTPQFCCRFDVFLIMPPQTNVFKNLWFDTHICGPVFLKSRVAKEIAESQTDLSSCFFTRMTAVFCERTLECVRAEKRNSSRCPTWPRFHQKRSNQRRFAHSPDTKWLAPEFRWHCVCFTGHKQEPGKNVFHLAEKSNKVQTTVLFADGTCQTWPRRAPNKFMPQTDHIFSV